jgi:L-alanine-DL-glutamate epimerase-like enolase superfamily enzyme
VRAGPVVIEIGPLQDRSLIPSIAAWPHPVIADAGGRYTRAYTDTLQAVAASGAALLAEPFADGDIVQTARLRRRLATPVSIPALTVEHTEAALYAHACEVVHLDPGVVGLFDSIRILDYVAERGVSAWVRSSARTPVGLSADLVVASHPASTWPIQLSARGEEILRETGPDGTLDRSVVDMILEPPEESRALASQLLLRVGS